MHTPMFGIPMHYQQVRGCVEIRNSALFLPLLCPNIGNLLFFESAFVS